MASEEVLIIVVCIFLNGIISAYYLGQKIDKSSNKVTLERMIDENNEIEKKMREICKNVKKP